MLPLVGGANWLVVGLVVEVVRFFGAAAGAFGFEPLAGFDCFLGAGCHDERACDGCDDSPDERSSGFCHASCPASFLKGLEHHVHVQVDNGLYALHSLHRHFLPGMLSVDVVD